MGRGGEVEMRGRVILGQSRFLSDNMASSTPWLHSLAFNNCSPLPAPLHDAEHPVEQTQAPALADQSLCWRGGCTGALSTA